MLESIISSGSLSIYSLLICSSCSIIFGLIIAFIHKLTTDSNKNFVVTLAIIPILIQSIILMTNGNLGTSVAIASAFSLVRFRSMPGTSKEIVSILFAMTIGLAMGMGQVVFAAIITVLVGLFILVLNKLKISDNSKVLKVVLPEDMDYESVFDEIFNNYLDSYRLTSVKTINMGSLFELTYQINEKNNIKEKEFIDLIRQRNSNLKVSVSHSKVEEGVL